MSTKLENGDITEGVIRIVTGAKKSTNGFDQCCLFVQTKDNGVLRVFQTLGTENEFAGHPSFRKFIFAQAGHEGSDNLKDLEALKGQSVMLMAEAYVGAIDDVTGQPKTGISYNVLAWGV